MIRLKMHVGWRDDQHRTREYFNRFCNRPYAWNGINLVEHDSDDYDYIAIFNYPRPWLKYDMKKAIIFQCEPDVTRKKWGKFYKPSNNDFFRAYNIGPDRCPPAWFIGKTYHELMKYDKIEKTKDLSAVVSGLATLQGHKERKDFCFNYLSRLDCYDHYGRNCEPFKSYRGPVANKMSGLFPYKYTFAGENSYENGYFTGKIMDAILSECLCFYSGCPNLSKYFDPRSYIPLDLSNKEESFETVRRCIQEDEYSKRLPYILKQKHKILNEIQPLPLIESIILGGE